MTFIFNTFIPILPQGKSRPKTVRLKNGMSHSYTPEATVSAEQAIRWHVSQVWHDAPLDEPISVAMVFVMPKPKSKPKKAIWPTGKPDVDNVSKLVMDALNGLLWRDDSRVVGMALTKVYGEKPGIHLEVMKPEVTAEELAALMESITEANKKSA